MYSPKHKQQLPVHFTGSTQITPVTAMMPPTSLSAPTAHTASSSVNRALKRQAHDAMWASRRQNRDRPLETTEPDTRIRETTKYENDLIGAFFDFDAASGADSEAEVEAEAEVEVEVNLGTAVMSLIGVGLDGMVLNRDDEMADGSGVIGTIDNGDGGGMLGEISGPEGKEAEEQAAEGGLKLAGGVTQKKSAENVMMIGLDDLTSSRRGAAARNADQIT